MQNEKARKDDQKAMMDELRRVVKDQDELAQRIGLRGGVSTVARTWNTPSNYRTTETRFRFTARHSSHPPSHR